CHYHQHHCWYHLRLSSGDADGWQHHRVLWRILPRSAGQPGRAGEAVQSQWRGRGVRGMLMANGLYKSQRGINLVELMVGIAISLVLLTGVLSVMLRISASGGEVVASTRLNQQMRGALDLMTKELQRSGYVNWFQAWDVCDDDPEDGNFADKH